MIPYNKSYQKCPNDPVPPGFWIGAIIVLLLFAWLHGCEGGVIP